MGDESRFKRLARHAATEKREGRRTEYWSGYSKGLRRAHYGDKYGTDDEHERWLRLADRKDSISQQRGAGYRAGLAAFTADDKPAIQGPPITPHHADFSRLCGDLLLTWESLMINADQPLRAAIGVINDQLGTRYDTNRFGKWRRGVEPVPVKVQDIMRRDILIWLFGAHDGAILAQALIM